MSALNLDEGLITTLIRSTNDGLAMANMVPVPIGASRYVTSTHAVTSIIGFVGAVCGSVSINMSSTAAKFLTGRILGGEQTELTNDALDTICEVINIIAGKLKAILSTSEYKIEKISVPSVVVGSNFSVTHYRGMQTVCVEFELPDVATRRNSDFIFSVALSMMRTS